MKRKSTTKYKNRFGYICMNCLAPGGHLHHIIPLSQGGLDSEENWIVLCESCHKEKKFHRNADIAEILLATKKHYFELGPEIGMPPQAFIFPPQRTINLIHPRNQMNPKYSIEEELEASTRLVGVNRRLDFPMLGFQNMKQLRRRLNRLIKNDVHMFSDVFNLLAEITKKGG